MFSGNDEVPFVDAKRVLTEEDVNAGDATGE